MEGTHTEDVGKRESIDESCKNPGAENIETGDESKVASRRLQQGAIGWILLWVIGIPIPVLLVFFLIRGCT
jgi:hypothetical protein